MSVQSGYATLASVSGAQAGTWTDPNNGVGGPNAVYASGVSGVGTQSKLYKLYGFGLAVPTGSTIKGVKVTTRMKVAPSDPPPGDAMTVSLAFNDPIVTNPKTVIDTDPLSHDVTVGSINDLWGSGFGASDLNHQNFGVVFQLTDNSGGAALGCNMDIDSCFVEVIYSAPGESITGTTPTGGISNVAYGTNEQYASSTQGKRLRVQPTVIQPKTFAAGSGTLAPLTPVAYNTSTNKWVVWTNGGANGTGTIKGFVGLDAVVLDAANEVLGNVILGGIIHYEDIVLPSGESAGNLKTALTGTVRQLGFTVQGLEKWY